MFEEEPDLKPRKLLRAYLRQHIKTKDQTKIKQPSRNVQKKKYSVNIKRCILKVFLRCLKKNQT